MLFANFAEAMAEGRGKAQADTLRKARSETVANRITASGSVEQVPSSKLRTGDLVLVSVKFGGCLGLAIPEELRIGYSLQAQVSGIGSLHTGL